MNKQFIKSAGEGFTGFGGAMDVHRKAHSDAFTAAMLSTSITDDVAALRGDSEETKKRLAHILAECEVLSYEDSLPKSQRELWSHESAILSHPIIWSVTSVSLIGVSILAHLSGALSTPISSTLFGVLLGFLIYPLVMYLVTLSHMNKQKSKLPNEKYDE